MIIVFSKQHIVNVAVLQFEAEYQNKILRVLQNIHFSSFSNLKRKYNFKLKKNQTIYITMNGEYKHKTDSEN